jgi:hypothetical protein
MNRLYNENEGLYILWWGVALTSLYPTVRYKFILGHFFLRVGNSAIRATLPLNKFLG